MALGNLYVGVGLKANSDDTKEEIARVNFLKTIQRIQEQIGNIK